MAVDATKKVRHVEYMDGLRGVLVLNVLLLHIFFAVVTVPGALPWYNWTQLWFQPGMYTVGLFVVISGYCLMLPVARSAEGRLSGGVTTYLWRRFRRIVPPYYVAATLSLLHVIFFRQIYTRNYGIAANPWTAGDIWSHVFLYYNFYRNWRFQINQPYWSLAPEWQLYLLFPVVLVPFWRRFGSSALVGTALAIVCGLVIWIPEARRMHVWFLFLFTAGMAGCVAAYSKEPRVIAMRERVPWATISSVLFGAFVVEWIATALLRPQTFATLPTIWPEWLINEDLLGIAILCAILHWHKVQIHHDRDQWPHVFRFLNHGSVKWLGRFSYSLYLVHWPIVLTLVSRIRLLGMAELPTMVLSYAIAAPVTVGLGYLFFLGVERHFLPESTRKAIAKGTGAVDSAPALP